MTLDEIVRRLEQRKRELSALDMRGKYAGNFVASHLLALNDDVLAVIRALTPDAAKEKRS